MPPRIPHPDEFIPNQLGKLWAGQRGALNQTTYVLDPTITNPAAGTPNCKAIIGDVSKDNFGNSTGLTGWGLASYKTNTWVKL